MGFAERNCGERGGISPDRSSGGPGGNWSNCFYCKVHRKSEYTFHIPQGMVEKEVHWYLMMSDSYYSKPQREEFFVDSGYYKFHEAYHLLKFSNEKQILERAYNEYLDLKKSNLWGNKKYF